MWKIVTTAAFMAVISGAALAQSGSGSTGGSAGGSQGGGGTNATPRAERTPGAMPGRSDIAPGSGRPRAGSAATVPPDQSAAQQARRGRGTSDLNNNSATTGPTGVGPTGVGPTGVGPTGLGPTGLGGSEAASGSMLDRTPALGTGTGARDMGVPDSSVYNPGAPSRQR